MPALRRIQFSPLSSVRAAIRIGVMATAATFSGDTDLDAAENKGVAGPSSNQVQVQRSSLDAQKFCAWLTERERAAGRLPDGFVYGLPSETATADSTSETVPEPNAGFRVALIPKK